MVLDMQLAEAEGEAARELARQVHRSVNRVQYLIDVVWDIFIGAAGALVGWAALRHPSYGRIWGGVGLAASLALLYLNLDTFPYAPAESGSVDVGPLVAIWFLAMFSRTFWLTRGSARDEKYP